MIEHSFRIIQCSPGRTASTVLTNVLYGLLCPDLPVSYAPRIRRPDSLITKTHRVSIDDWQQALGDELDLYFVCSERADVGILDKRYHSYSNVLVLQYEDLLCTSTYTERDVVRTVSRGLSRLLPPDVVLNETAAVQRFERMNEFYETIKHRPYSFYDEFFHIHGSHRNRADMVEEEG